MTDTDIAALVERLRDQAESYDDRAGMLEREAANALEALQAERDMLQDELIKASELIDADLLARAVKAEAALAQHVVHSALQPTTEGFFAMPNHDEQELNTLIDALRELAGRLDDDGDRALIEEAVKAVDALAELEAQDNGEDEEPAEDGGENA